MLPMLFLACMEEPALLEVPVEHLPGPSQLALEAGTLHLSRASWTVSALRLQAPTALSRAPLPSLWIRSAQAHPGHDFAGEVWGELLGTWTLDLLAEEPQVLGLAQIYEGELATASLVLDAVHLQGELDEGRAPLRFDLSLAPEAELAGLDLDLEISEQSPGALVLSVDLAHARSFMDWSDPDGDGVLSLSEGETENTLRFGVLSTPSLNLSWKE